MAARGSPNSATSPRRYLAPSRTFKSGSVSAVSRTGAPLGALLPHNRPEQRRAQALPLRRGEHGDRIRRRILEAQPGHAVGAPDAKDPDLLERVGARARHRIVLALRAITKLIDHEVRGTHRAQEANGDRKLRVEPG